MKISFYTFELVAIELLYEIVQRRPLRTSWSGPDLVYPAPGVVVCRPHTLYEIMCFHPLSICMVYKIGLKNERIFYFV